MHEDICFTIKILIVKEELAKWVRKIFVIFKK